MSSQPLRPTKACKKKRHFLLAFVFNWLLVNYYHFFNTRMKDRELRPLEDVLCILVHGGWMEVSQYHVQLVMLNTSLTSVESLMWRSSIWKVMVILRINHVLKRLIHEFHHNWKVKGRQDICPCYYHPKEDYAVFPWFPAQLVGIFAGNVAILDASWASEMNFWPLKRPCFFCFIPFYWFEIVFLYRFSKLLK